MLTSIFICDYCGEKYPANLHVKGAFKSIVYKDNKGLEHEVELAIDPCFKCEEEAQKAREEALLKRKQQRTI